MMITPDILPILRCPCGGDALVLADVHVIERVNAAIAAGTARDQLGTRVEEPIDAGLVNQAGDRLYPVREDIATLIADSAIRISELG
ncbi:Trm112 family protein [Aporhodopirellula aestuarii]|uniref:Trm112 family protein n=1 Tax=Aporhodopirellula aestuarii TaxID=2950107 RepID=A0ABT0U3X6_9BACT|nr:Trm112 family protein [Aporhodopirellula aestuarii]MCM2371626.1 Trm112 family protein [Aporhodopirellula aestuarii]